MGRMIIPAYFGGMMRRKNALDALCVCIVLLTLLGCASAFVQSDHVLPDLTQDIPSPTPIITPVPSPAPTAIPSPIPASELAMVPE